MFVQQRVSMQRWKREVFYRLAVLLFCLLPAFSLCSCGRNEDSAVLEKYEESCEFMGINMNLEEKAEYTAEQSGDKLLGYPAALSLQCTETIPEKDLAEIACEYLISYITGSNADIVECTVSILSEQTAEGKLLLRFSDSSRGQIAVYSGEEPKEKADYLIDKKLPEDLLLYTEISAEECNYTLPDGQETMHGSSVLQEISLLQEISDERLKELLKKHILQEQEELDDDEFPRVEYRFEIYRNGERQETVVMRCTDDSRKNWG